MALKLRRTSLPKSYYLDNYFNFVLTDENK